MEQNLLGMMNHLDSTSFSVQGEYEVQDDPKVVEITHGHSKDQDAYSAPTGSPNPL